MKVITTLIWIAALIIEIYKSATAATEELRAAHLTLMLCIIILLKMLGNELKEERDNKH